MGQEDILCLVSSWQRNIGLFVNLATLGGGVGGGGVGLGDSWLICPHTESLLDGKEATKQILKSQPAVRGASE